MISSKDISTSQRLNCLLDIFFMLGILLRNSEVTTVEVCLKYSFSIFFSDLRMSLEYFDLLSSVYNSNIVCKFAYSVF